MRDAAGRTSAAVAIFAAITISIVYYGKFYDNYFVYDDFRYLVNNLLSFKDVILGFDTLRVVSNLSWWPTYKIAGLNPAPFTAISIIIHIFNCVLLFFVARKLLHDDKTAATASVVFSASATASDVIFWKASNSSIFCLSFYLLALLAYISWRNKQEAKYLWNSLFCYALSMFSKEDASSFPLVIVLIEIFFIQQRPDLKKAIRRSLPFVAIVLVYTGATYTVFNVIMKGQSAPQSLFLFRPLYSLIGGGSIFYIGPDGNFRLDSAIPWVTAGIITAALFIMRWNRIAIFSLLWIIVTFLPQSLTGHGMFTPRELTHSVSRYMYLPSIGFSLFMSVAFWTGVKRLPRKVGGGFLVVALSLLVYFNYQRVQERGSRWRAVGGQMEEFLEAMHRTLPTLPPETHIHVAPPPQGRAPVLQALRASYQNPSIQWVDDITSVQLLPEQRGLLVVNRGKLGIEVHPF